MYPSRGPTIPIVNLEPYRAFMQREPRYNQEIHTNQVTSYAEGGKVNKYLRVVHDDPYFVTYSTLNLK